MKLTWKDIFASESYQMMIIGVVLLLILGITACCMGGVVAIPVIPVVIFFSLLIGSELPKIYEETIKEKELAIIKRREPNDQTFGRSS